MSSRILTILATLMLGSAQREAAATQAVRGDYLIPISARAPVLDGRISGAEWATGLRVDGFAQDGMLQRRRARAYITATTTHLYFAIWSELPVRGTILSEIARDSENLVYDDSVELWLDPTPDAARGARLQMLTNSRGHRWFKKHAYGGTPEQPDWRGDWSVAHGLHEGGWHCEIGVPLSDVAPGRAVASGAWGVNLCRNWKQEWAWSSLGGAAYKPTEIVRFAPGAPSVSVENRTDLHAGRVEVALSVTNNTSRPAAYLSLLRLERDLMPEARAGGLVTVGPGQTSTTLLRLEDATSRKFTLTASVKDDDIMAMQRTVAWIADRAPWQWVAAQKVVPPPDARFSYYPYRNQMRLLVDVSNMPEGATVARVEAVVRRKGGSEVKRVRFDRLRQGRQELAFDLPPLKGEYEIALRAFGRGVPDVEVVRPFERTVFDWEHNKLGTGPKVYAPFTPIRVVGKRVFTVLRDHTMADSGLWTQVRARGKDLLAGPMRWETGGAVRAEPLRFVESAGHRAVAQARFRAGKVRGSVRATWDYDGMMRVDADLAPIAPTGADAAVDLVIPLRAEQATHYHAMGDGIRNTLYDRVPNGSGVVWSSKQVACNDLPPGFCSYVYVGTPVRGLCWFAENDRGWLWDRSTPNVEIVRKSGIVEVRVHVVSRGRKLTGPRRITFGLQAAPVKPRLGADWRHKWRRDNYSLLGTDINWLALGDCGSVYPAHKDLYLWEMIKRGNRERLPELEIAKVVERAKPYFAPYGPDRIASLEAHVRHNLTSRYGTKMVFYYNRASFQLAPEFETFKDEWALSDYRTVEKGSGIYEIQIVPSASYIDHAVWWYDKSLTIGGNQGVYWDNWFFRGSYNTGATAAYAMPDRSITPATGIWGLRELAKRTFQRMGERRMKPITMAHMTSTGILPLLSFCTVQYDWEWKYSEGDVQDRFSRDYILMVSNGELAGTWPVLLGDAGPLAQDRHTARTFAGSAMLHELDCSYEPWSESGRMKLALFKPIDDILKRPGVMTFRYWDDGRQPVATDDPDVPVIVYAVKGSEAIVGIVGYADSDRNVRVRIDSGALGLAFGFVVTDAESGAALPVSDGAVSLRLPKHDLRVLRLRAGRPPQ